MQWEIVKRPACPGVDCRPPLFHRQEWRAGPAWRDGVDVPCRTGPPCSHQQRTSAPPASTNRSLHYHTSGSSAIHSQHESTKAMAAAQVKETRRDWRTDSRDARKSVGVMAQLSGGGSGGGFSHGRESSRAEGGGDLGGLSVPPSVSCRRRLVSSAWASRSSSSSRSASAWARRE